MADDREIDQMKQALENVRRILQPALSRDEIVRIEDPTNSGMQYPVAVIERKNPGTGLTSLLSLVGHVLLLYALDVDTANINVGFENAPGKGGIVLHGASIETLASISEADIKEAQYRVKRVVDLARSA